MHTYAHNQCYSKFSPAWCMRSSPQSEHFQMENNPPWFVKITSSVGLLDYVACSNSTPTWILELHKDIDNNSARPDYQIFSIR